MNQKQFGKYWWAKLLVALFVIVSPLAACHPKEESTQSVSPATTPAPQSTPVPYGIGKIVITPREDLDPLADGQQKGISVNFTLSVPDPEVIKYQYFMVSNAAEPIFVLNGYETPVGDVKITNFASPQISFTKNGESYVCPPVDPVDPFVVDCGGVLSVLLSN